MGAKVWICKEAARREWRRAAGLDAGRELRWAGAERVGAWPAGSGLSAAGGLEVGVHPEGIRAKMWMVESPLAESLGSKAFPVHCAVMCVWCVLAGLGSTPLTISHLVLAAGLESGSEQDTSGCSSVGSRPLGLILHTQKLLDFPALVAGQCAPSLWGGLLTFRNL